MDKTEFAAFAASEQGRKISRLARENKLDRTETYGLGQAAEDTEVGVLFAIGDEVAVTVRSNEGCGLYVLITMEDAMKL